MKRAKPKPVRALKGRRGHRAGHADRGHKAFGQVRRVSTRLKRLEEAVSRIETALEFDLTKLDPDRPGDFDRLEARRARTSRELLARELRALKSRGVIDAAGEVVSQDLPADMREDSGCDL
jgi:chromosome segregation ATPase